MNKEIILITGATGCVGQYIANWLLQNSNAELLLWLRDPKKLSSIAIPNPRVKLLIGDIRDPFLFKEDLAKATRVIHTATAWGDPKRAIEVNVLAVKNLLSLLNPQVLKQVIYFSTASILNEKLQLLPESFKYGTEYIQTKAQCFSDLENHKLADRIIAVFPTLVFGGRVDRESIFPTSYLTQGLAEARKWLWLARFIRLDSRFHFIHAKDIAFICGHIATTENLVVSELGQGNLKKVVLAQPAISINQAINILCQWRGVRRIAVLPLWVWLLEILIKILPIQISKWDRFSIQKRHFVHESISPPEHFGGKSYAKTLQKVLEVSGLT